MKEGWVVVWIMTALAIGGVFGIQVQGASISNDCARLGKFRFGGETFICMKAGEQRTKQI